MKHHIRTFWDLWIKVQKTYLEIMSWLVNDNSVIGLKFPSISNTNCISLVCYPLLISTYKQADIMILGPFSLYYLVCNLNLCLRYQFLGCRDGPMIKGIHYSSRVLEFSCKPPHVSSQLPVIPVQVSKTHCGLHGHRTAGGTFKYM